jgi:hypothetical protein
MKTRFEEEGTGAAAKPRRKGSRRCPCCGAAPCACEKTCFCQELKGEVNDEEEDEPAPEVDFHFSFLRHGETSA